ncbi:hypothetical protein EW146_g728 [Bondarzewia mesenterica]|uniref:glucan 1,3-beta-glucosidase n=1 Tax=Bondarzewia mesenterica TaxID=1095465 RepID=A0A4V3XGB1_9AGAM|nr:hypothetical protein EW146_g728 [Bondarzewia mesenterica]
MPRPDTASDSVSYDPLPNPAAGTHQDFPYNNPSEEDMVSTPQLGQFDFDVPQGAARPRFMGAALGHEGPRESIGSFDSRPQSEVGSSVYALNPESLSARDSPRPGYTEPFAGRYRDDPNTPDTYEETGVPMSSVSGDGRYLAEKRAVYAAPRVKSRRNLIILAVLGGLIVIIIAVVVPIYFAVIKPRSDAAQNDSAAVTSKSASASASASSSASPASRAAITGGDGSKVTMKDGSTFTYQNSFGGYWYDDPNDPFNNGAQAQSWTPALNETFKWGVDRIRGVNLGGWLNTEPFIVPALYQKYLNSTPITIDEWTLSINMAADTASGGLSQLEDHYNTFITEEDFAQIAGAGLNFVRIPLPYWAIEVRDGEPFLPKTAWTYFLKAIKWARKYGIRINLDFHALPGSQNGWNHSGRLGTINVLNGTMGYANAQRSLDYIRILAEFISQPEYKDVVVMFGITNEPSGKDMAICKRMTSFDWQVVLARAMGPLSPIMTLFFGLTQWAGFLDGADRIALDYHPYLCFQAQTSAPMSQQTTSPCDAWGSSMNTSMAAFGLTAAGEFSNAVTDCGLYVNGVNLGTRYEGTYPGNWPAVGSCAPWTEWESWNKTMKANIKSFALSSMDALQNWFFWTWKIGNSTSGRVEAPAWSYQLGLQNGWMPTDPREANGVCGNVNPWTGSLTAAQTGGSGAGIAASITSQYSWPPTTVNNANTGYPSYTPTGTIPTLAGPTFTSASSSINAGSGWANPSDTAGLMVPISGCQYLSPWLESSVADPPVCTPASKRSLQDMSAPKITAAS